MPQSAGSYCDSVLQTVNRVPQKSHDKNNNKFSTTQDSDAGITIYKKKILILFKTNKHYLFFCTQQQAGRPVQCANSPAWPGLKIKYEFPFISQIPILFLLLNKKKFYTICHIFYRQLYLKKLVFSRFVPSISTSAN